MNCTLNFDALKNIKNKVLSLSDPETNDNDQVNYEDTDEDNDSNTSDDVDVNDKKSYLFYNEQQDVLDELNDYNYHLYKNSGHWLLAKQLVKDTINDKLNTEFFWDYLDLLFEKNDDDFNNIIKVIYSSNNSVFEFDTPISKYIVDNLKICKYKPNSYLFNNDEHNIWSFKIVVITSKNIYSANRYTNDNKIGCF